MIKLWTTTINSYSTYCDHSEHNHEEQIFLKSITTQCEFVHVRCYVIKWDFSATVEVFFYRKKTVTISLYM